MCGRKACALAPDLIQKEMRCDEQTWEGKEFYRPSYNAGPGRFLPVLYRGGDGQRHICSMQWGLWPAWASRKGPLINARAETLLEKRTFKTAACTRRCVVLVDGWFEWAKLTGNRKQPFFFRMAGRQLTAMAALYEESSEGVRTYTVITVDAAPRWLPIHDRMPALLAHADIDVWLGIDGGSGSGSGGGSSSDGEATPSPTVDSATARALALLRPWDGDLEWYAVASSVGSVSYDSPDAIHAVELPADIERQIWGPGAAAGAAVAAAAPAPAESPMHLDAAWTDRAPAAKRSPAVAFGGSVKQESDEAAAAGGAATAAAEGVAIHQKRLKMTATATTTTPATTTTTSTATTMADDDTFPWDQVDPDEMIRDAEERVKRERGAAAVAVAQPALRPPLLLS